MKNQITKKEYKARRLSIGNTLNLKVQNSMFRVQFLCRGLHPVIYKLQSYNFMHGDHFILCKHLFIRGLVTLLGRVHKQILKVDFKKLIFFGVNLL